MNFGVARAAKRIVLSTTIGIEPTGRLSSTYNSKKGCAMGMAKFLPSPIDYYDQTVTRGSGRTTRMLMEADYAKRNGERVAIFMHSTDMIRYCGHLVYEHRLVLDEKDFYLAQGDRNGWSLRGADARIYLDHHLIELMNDRYNKKFSDFYNNYLGFDGSKLNITKLNADGSVAHVHDFKYVSMDDDDVELWACGCGENEYREEPE